MAIRKTLNIGAFANDGTGDTLRDASDKINYNFNLLFDRIKTETTTGSNVISQDSGMVLFSETPSSHSLQVGQYVGDTKYLISISNGTATLNGTFNGGTQLSLSGRASCQIIWTGNYWSLLSSNGASIT